jgi:hypothetical protein
MELYQRSRRQPELLRSRAIANNQFPEKKLAQDRAASVEMAPRAPIENSMSGHAKLPGEPGDDAGVGGAGLMTTAAPGVQFEIKVDGVARSYRDVRDTAM